MYIKLKPEVLEKVETITNTLYSPDDDLVEVTDIMIMIEDLIYEYNLQKKEFNDYKQYVEDNYRPPTYEEMYD